MYYCKQCQVTRNLPKTALTEKSVQCNFCDRAITKCYQGKYSTLVDSNRNCSKFLTSKKSIIVEQEPTMPKELPVTKIYPGEHKQHVNDKMIIVFIGNLSRNGLTKIRVVNRHTGEEVSISM